MATRLALLLLLAAACSDETEPTVNVGAEPQATPPAAPGAETAPLEALPEPTRQDVTPSPDETAWSAAELSALHVVRRIVGAQQRFDPRRPLSAFPDAVMAPGGYQSFAEDEIAVVGGYCYRIWLSDGSGRPVTDQDARAKGDHFCLYAWPERGPGRTFCGFDRGVLVTGPGYAGRADGPEAEAAFAPKAETMPQGLKGPGEGQDGNRWIRAPYEDAQPVAVFRIIEQSGSVRSEYPVMTLPRAWLDREEAADMLPHVLPIDEALPMGRAKSGPDGRIAIRGLHATGMALLVPDEASKVEIRREGSETLIVVPDIDESALTQARRNANQSAAIATLKNLASAQAQCQASGVIDTNNNGAGEYGYFAELAGTAPVRLDGVGNTGTLTITPPVLSSSFGKVERSCVVRSGYVFQVWLPGQNGTFVPEAVDGGAGPQLVDSALGEVLWCAYAWPVEPEVSGSRVYFVNQAGDVMACDNKDKRYAGLDRRPDPWAAYEGRGFEAAAATNKTGNDGHTWIVVN